MAEFPYGGAVVVFGFLFLAALACLAGIWKPILWLAILTAIVFFGLGLLVAPNTDGVFQVVALPVGCVAAFGVKERRTSV